MSWKRSDCCFLLNEDFSITDIKWILFRMTTCKSDHGPVCFAAAIGHSYLFKMFGHSALHGLWEHTNQMWSATDFVERARENTSSLKYGKTSRTNQNMCSNYVG